MRGESLNREEEQETRSARKDGSGPGAAAGRGSVRGRQSRCRRWKGRGQGQTKERHQRFQPSGCTGCPGWLPGSFMPTLTQGGAGQHGAHGEPHPPSLCGEEREHRPTAAAPRACAAQPYIPGQGQPGAIFDLLCLLSYCLIAPHPSPFPFCPSDHLISGAVGQTRE